MFFLFFVRLFSFGQWNFWTFQQHLIMIRSWCQKNSRRIHVSKKKFIFVDMNFYLFNVNFAFEHNLIHFFWLYDVKILIYVFAILFVFFMISFICEWYVINSFHIIFNNLQIIFQMCFTNCWFLFDIIAHDNSYHQKVIYTKIHVIFSTQICFMSLKIMFLLNLTMIIIKFVQSLFFDKFTIKFTNNSCQILSNMNNKRSRFFF